MDAFRLFFSSLRCSPIRPPRFVFTVLLHSCLLRIAFDIPLSPHAMIRVKKKCLRTLKKCTRAIFFEEKNAILRGLLFFYECFLSLDGGKGGILGALRKYSFLKTGRSFGEHRCETVIIAFHFHSFFPFSQVWVYFCQKYFESSRTGGKGVSGELCEK